MKFDDESQRKSDITNDEIDTNLNEITKDLQECFENNAEKPYADWDSDYINEFNNGLSK